MAAESWKWLSSAYNYVVLDMWTIMPNHLRGIIFDQPCRGGSRAAPTSEFKIKPLGQIIGAFKTISTKQINIHRKIPGIPFWQRGFYEHVIRHEEALNRIRDYIATNPLRWELDRENPQATGNDDFDVWLTKFQPKPTKQDIEL
jgi:putative transposase